MEHHWTSSNFNSRPLRKSHAAVKYLLYIWIFTFVTRKNIDLGMPESKPCCNARHPDIDYAGGKKNWVQSSEAFGTRSFPIDYPSVSLNMAMETPPNYRWFSHCKPPFIINAFFNMAFLWFFFMAFPHENHHENRGLGDFQLPHQATARKYPTSKKAWIGVRLDWKRANRARFETTKSVHFVFVKRMCM